MLKWGHSFYQSSVSVIILKDISEDPKSLREMADCQSMSEG